MATELLNPPVSASLAPPEAATERPKISPRPAAPPASASTRLVSLDAFRGLTILLMLLVNNIALDAATPRHLTHADWSGRVHLADLVFPWFLFIVGVAIPWAAASRRRRGVPFGRYLVKAAGRALTLIALGWLMDSTVARQLTIGLGVLQLIGLAYLAGALLCELPPWLRGAAAGALLIGHWALIRFVPIPGVGAGVFTEERNLIVYLNQVYLAPWHLKGLLSVLPTAALVLIGTIVGDLLRRGAWSARRKLTALALLGTALVAIGLVWSRDLPMNKPLWTAPYILYTGGWGILMLGALYALTDVAGWRAWAFPLYVAGMNAIFAYVVPILVKINVLQGWRWPSETQITVEQALQQGCYACAGRTIGGWLYTLAYMGFWWLVLWFLYRRNVFLRV